MKVFLSHIAPSAVAGAVLFLLYLDWPPATFPYVKHLVAWVLAYLPGLWLLLRSPN